MKNPTEEKIIKWAEQKGIAKIENIHKQTLKLAEELGEFTSEILKGDRDKARMELGDILVVSAILANQLDVDLEICIKQAYEKIESRTGTTKDGVFVKN